MRALLNRPGENLMHYMTFFKSRLQSIVIRLTCFLIFSSLLFFSAFSIPAGFFTVQASPVSDDTGSEENLAAEENLADRESLAVEENLADRESLAVEENLADRRAAPPAKPLTARSLMKTGLMRRIPQMNTRKNMKRIRVTNGRQHGLKTGSPPAYPDRTLTWTAWKSTSAWRTTSWEQ